MKTISKYIFYVIFSSFFLLSVCLGQSAHVKHEKEIVAWLKSNSFPVKHLTAGKGFADLQPLKTILQEVQVVGLGESTHGTREMFQLKHRLLEFLALEMGFTAIALEASYAACQPINEYVLYHFPGLCPKQILII
ncbi:erythromycin esterase family protein [Rhodocytophaga rosea]|uniref:Erythromycin esterase family protein n=1 Tax=Rhodocytophaga rosea TaxID=2704465 RepID=A0A6C0GS21_9BACT|nr:erythromycin esterase family protein [Rhodocytophaga rosea]QHT70891.1 erythromycin esterase family protein [Rhodocytophaga rosea]